LDDFQARCLFHLRTKRCARAKRRRDSETSPCGLRATRWFVTETYNRSGRKLLRPGSGDGFGLSQIHQGSLLVCGPFMPPTVPNASKVDAMVNQLGVASTASLRGFVNRTAVIDHRQYWNWEDRKWANRWRHKRMLWRLSSATGVVCARCEEVFGDKEIE